MAFYSMTLRDAFGRETQKTIEVKTQVDLASYNSVGSALIAALEAITDLAVVRCDIILKNQIPLTGTPAEGANVDVGATFGGELAGDANRKASHKVPGITLSLVSADGTIDLTQGVIDTYLDQFLATGQLLLSDGEEMGEWLKGVLDR